MLGSFGGSAFQMTLSDACSSANTVVAPTIRVATATMVAIVPETGFPALAIIA